MTVFAQNSSKKNEVNALTYSFDHMPGLIYLLNQYTDTRPLKGLAIGFAYHFTPQTAAAVKLLHKMGATLFITPSNPYTVHPVIAQELQAFGQVFYDENIYSTNGDKHEKIIKTMLEALFSHKAEKYVLIDQSGVLGNTAVRHGIPLDTTTAIIEGTTSGTHVFQHHISNGYKMPAVYDIAHSILKLKIANPLGIQDILKGVEKTTHQELRGKEVVVIGYGSTGQGVAEACHAAGAHVNVVDVDPIRGLQALMKGYRVGSLDTFVESSHFFFVVTGSVNVIPAALFNRMQDQSVICNIGNSRRELNDLPTETGDSQGAFYEVINDLNHRVLISNKGHVANIIMGASFSNYIMSIVFTETILTVLKIVGDGENQKSGEIVPLPLEIEEECATIHLAALGVTLPQQTTEQRSHYNMPDTVHKWPNYHY